MLLHKLLHLMAMMRIVSVTGVQVNKRFNGRAPQDCNCVMQTMTLDKLDDAAAKMQHHFKRLSGFYKANCSDNIITLTTAGHLVNGTNYTGILGYIQRNEITNTIYLMRTDDLPLEVGIVGPPLASTAGTILMAEHNNTVIEKDLITIIMYNFDVPTYAYIFTCLILCSIFVHFDLLLDCDLKRNRLKLKPLKYLKIVWQMLRVAASQFSYKARNLQLKYIWGGFLIGITFLFLFVGRNLISSDLVVVIKEAHPETLNDLLSPKFSHLDVNIIGQLQLNTMIDDDERFVKLKERIHRNEANILTVVSPDKMEPVLDAVERGKIAIIFEEYIFQFGMPLLCKMRPAAGQTIHVAKERIAEGYGYALYSAQTKPRLVNYLNYKYRTSLEMGTYKMFVEKDAPMAILDYMDEKFPIACMICLEFNKNITVPTFKAFNFQDVESFFILCLVLIAISLFVLVIETFININEIGIHNYFEMIKENEEINEMKTKRRKKHGNPVVMTK